MGKIIETIKTKFPKNKWIPKTDVIQVLGNTAGIHLKHDTTWCQIFSELERMEIVEVRDIFIRVKGEEKMDKITTLSDLPFEQNENGNVVFEKENVRKFLQWMANNWERIRDNKDAGSEAKKFAKYYIDCVLSIMKSLGLEKTK